MAEVLSRRIDDLVLHAAGLDETARQRFLGEMDEEIATEVRLRLALAVPTSFLGVPAAVAFEDSQLEDSQLEGSRIEGAEASGEDAKALKSSAVPEERYELGELLGEGGMARVYRAFDRQLERPVALKFLDHEDTATLRRFVREARAQARVRHPHVLEVYETGVLGETPYIAMHHVDGRTLGEARGELSLEELVRLLVEVAEGLDAAHQVGLVHRDVKPSNVLVEEGADGVLHAWVSDFGIAAGLEAPGERAELAGTPPYMAPERFAVRGPDRTDGAPLDRRGDVYSLGVTMFQMMTGELPFQGELDELVPRVRDEEPPSARDVAPNLPPALAAVIARCLAKDPAARYPTAAAVAADLRRHLAGEVVEAHAASLAYRVSTFALRYRALLTLGGVAAVLLIAALAVAAGLGVEALRANERAEARRDQAESLVDFMLVDLRGKLDPLGRLDILDDVGAAAMEYFARVPFEELTDEELSRRSRALYQIGEVRVGQGRLDAAQEPLAESLELARELSRRAPEDGERLFELGQSWFWLGFVFFERGDTAAARQPFEEYLDVSRRLVEKDADNLDWQLELSYAHSNLGSLLQEDGNLEGAFEQFSKTLDVHRRLVEAEPENLTWRSELATSHNLVGSTVHALGRLEEARRHFEIEVETWRELVEAKPEHAGWRRRLGRGRLYLGRQLLFLGQAAAAEEHFLAARGLFQELVDHDPSNTAWRFQLAVTHLRLGETAAALGRPAGEDWRRHQEIVAALNRLEPDHLGWRENLGLGHFHLALAAWTAGDAIVAGIEACRAVEMLEALRAIQPSSPKIAHYLAESHLLLGVLSERSGASEEALAARRRALEIVETAGRGVAEVRLLFTKAKALLANGDVVAARAVVERLEAMQYREPELTVWRKEKLALAKDH